MAESGRPDRGVMLWVMAPCSRVSVYAGETMLPFLINSGTSRMPIRIRELEQLWSSSQKPMVQPKRRASATPWHRLSLCPMSRRGRRVRSGNCSAFSRVLTATGKVAVRRYFCTASSNSLQMLMCPHSPLKP